MCKDLKKSGKDIRDLFDVMKIINIYKKINTIILYIDLQNPYINNALSLYLSKGFIYSYKNNNYITMTCTLPNYTNLSKKETELYLKEFKTKFI